MSDVQNVKKIDIHAHGVLFKEFFPPHWVKNAEAVMVSAEEVIDLYDRLGIEKGILLPISSPEGQMSVLSSESCKYLADKYPDRFCWFCNADPRAGDNTPDGDLARILRHYKALGAKGVGEITCLLPAPMRSSIPLTCSTQVCLPEWNLRIEIYDTRAEMGLAAGTLAAERIREVLRQKNEVNVIFAAAPSQNEMLDTLVKAPDIDWRRVNAFHMDEYTGLSKDAPQCFGNFLKDHIFSKLPFKSINYIDCEATDMEAECARYTALLRDYPVDIVLLGIGENGHIAFNDPHVADFNDPAMVKVAALDPVCRQQQVNDGCFASLADVPEYALTLTIPALAKADHLVCTVPAATKAWAVEQTVNGEIGAHLEGPYFSKKQCGAQNPDFITPPVKADYLRLLDSFGDVILRWSFAPELEGADAFMQELNRRGVVASAPAFRSWTRSSALRKSGA